ncbi:MAG: asparagine synthase (glutamine-hydrolyzing), partial [Rhodothermales bacterium]|nr:asparagine synthase (glutamine-hydrolyzing) [Rhodothermales bacterium]
MCGIAGFVNFNGHDKREANSRIRAMTETLVHRGPDGDGYFVDDRAALGHRRLAIIDMQTGSQPMSDLHDQLQIVFNGEIYNFQALRRELEGFGHCFRTRSDTEVILKAFVQWGSDCLQHLNGMFAFAIWDTRSGMLFLARDRVGKKPLFFQVQENSVSFGSELTALVAGGSVSKQIDPESLDCYLTLGYVPAPRTIYRGVHKLEPAQFALISRDSVRKKKYWELSFAESTSASFDDIVDEFEELLDECVSCRLISEVPLGAFLSGGLDSSLVVSSMTKFMNDAVKTHSIGFDDNRFNELGAARSIADHLSTEHTEFVVQPKAIEVLPKIARYLDEPLADSSVLPTWYVCEMTRQSVTVALSGDGGDESFGGYTFRYLPHTVESRIRSVLPAAVRGVTFGSLGAIWPHSARLPKALRLKSIFENLAVSD